MADRGLQAYVVPSARAGQQPDPAARRDALTGLMSGGFLLAILAVVLAIVIAAPQYAEPAVGAGVVADVDEPASLDGGTTGAATATEVTTSKPPGKLKGYRWPVRGGFLDTFYGKHSKGRFEIEGERVHDGIVITWFEGATVKAAHKGTVVAAGRDWLRHAGYQIPVDKVYERYADPAEKPGKDKGAKKGRKQGKAGRKPRYPLGVVVDDGNGYYSIYSEIKDLRVKVGDKVKAGQVIAGMSRAEGKQMMRYRLVRMDGPQMKVHQSDRERGYPNYARERIDPLAVLDLDVKKRPKRAEKGPKRPPRLSDY